MEDTETEAAADEEEIVVLGAHRHPFDPSQGTDSSDLVCRAHHRHQLAVRHGMAAMPMLRETRDGQNRTGFAYEGEPLLVFVKPVAGGWKVVANRQVPIEGSRVLTETIAAYDDALDAAFDIARRLPSGLAYPCNGSAC